MSSLVLKKSQPPDWLSGDINEASNPVTVTLHGGDGRNVSGIPLTFLAADSKFVKGILLVQDEAEEDKQITLASTSTEIISIYVSLICTGLVQLDGDRKRQETIVKKLEDLLILLQSQIRLDTRDLDIKHEQDTHSDEDLRFATVAEVDKGSPDTKKNDKILGGGAVETGADYPGETRREDVAGGFSTDESKKVKTEDGELETTEATEDTFFVLVPQEDRLFSPSAKNKCENYSSAKSTSEAHASIQEERDRDQVSDVLEDVASIHKAEKSLKSEIDHYSFKQHISEVDDEEMSTDEECDLNNFHATVSQKFYDLKLLKKCIVNVKNVEVRVKNVRVDVKKLDKNCTRKL